MTRSRLLASIILLALVGAALGYVLLKGSRVPRPGSETYEQTVQAFYTGVAALQVGLLDDAGRNFDKATKLAPYLDTTMKSGRAWGVYGLPTSILIDRQGREVGRLIGMAEWDRPDALKLIDAVIAEK